MNVSHSIRNEVRSCWASGYRPIKLLVNSAIYEQLIKEATSKFIIHWLTFGMDPFIDESINGFIITRSKLERPEKRKILQSVRK